MRRIILPGIFLMLVAALYLLWQHRFERSPGFPTLRLADLRELASPVPGVEWLGPENQPKLRLRVDQAHPRVVMHLDFPNMKAVDFLHLRFYVSARKLTCGRESWEDGRCMIEWHPPSGGPVWENDPFCSARHDEEGWVTELVSRPNHPPAIPALRVENLGTAGDLEVSMFEATVLRETLVWKIGRWVLMGAWLAWAIAWIGPVGKRGFVRSLAAASICLLMGIYFVVPGPWKSLHSFGIPFQIGEEIKICQSVAALASSPESTTRKPRAGRPVVFESVGKIADTEDITLRIRYYTEKARPILHVLLLFGPTLLIACLVGRKPALTLGAIFAVGTEVAEFSFGYGFDRMDVFDLACDTIGIVLAIWVHRKVLEKTANR